MSNIKKQFWWNNSQHRALFFQVLLVAMLVGFFWFIGSNTLTNLNNRGISTGFGFLSQVSGFGIIQHLVPFDETYTFGRTFLVGLLNTLIVSAVGVVFATIIGVVVGIARLSNNWLIAKLATVYIEIFRNIPLLLQMFFWYFAVLRTLPAPKQSWSAGDVVFLNIRGLYLPEPVFGPHFNYVFWCIGLAIVATLFISRWAKRRQDLTGKQFKTKTVGMGLIIGLPAIVFFLVDASLSWNMPALKGFNFQGGITVIPEFTALATALSIYTGAFIAEVVRSGILSVNSGQTEAASSLGLHKSRVLKLVVIPQAMRVIIPQLTSQYLNLVKNSSLATAIGYPDLVAVFAGTTLNQTGQAIEVIAMTMGVYLFISLLISGFMNWYNKKMLLVER
ncbi:MAG: amino acid ABC transporter permease [Proteobacteria bacterium]|nr:amino acid ABC transporter permease [Pseudomonadota bacterium]MBU1137398.1 amino acid ABC transporter permease [Pseudomonadota bacterium]MBU1231845.1 amino acid ABC transporter permease [Pseudomonadota bacterium]MBU1420828.1 amino acid ABC transporter permease [Pseudomonadota bacterium]MBU1454580.1 amino acid ABC transporter permease [Pseudomonadota bacterium]